MRVTRWHVKLVFDCSVAPVSTRARDSLWYHQRRARAPTSAAPSAAATTAAARALIKPHSASADNSSGSNTQTTKRRCRPCSPS